MISQDVARVCRPAVLNLVESDAGKTFEEGRRGLGLQDIVKLSSNENSLGPSPRSPWMASTCSASTRRAKT